MISPFEELGNAVVVLAAKDWREATEKLKHGRKNSSAEAMKAECERFFKSPEFNKFTSLDGKMILAKLESEVGV